MDREIREEREDRRRVWMVDGVGRLAQPELRLQRAIGVRQECPARADAGAEGGATSGASTLTEIIRE